MLRIRKFGENRCGYYGAAWNLSLSFCTALATCLRQATFGRRIRAYATNVLAQFSVSRSDLRTKCWIRHNYNSYFFTTP